MARLLIIKTGDAFDDVVRDHGDFEDFFRAALAPVAEALMAAMTETPEAGGLLARFAERVACAP